ncbi:hypothetical protein ACH4Y0_19570 [Streptomyces sp. NPDC020707]|jgi:hypothetical protein|uniref:Uncharacterized protein n=1 Tax=Streptomyces ortus TaxID=2867268 RepID=A0ABT3VK72_9ACTN|nr:hypothetical protein [Streptomyces ortus]MCX4238708.1 hypothetical protein [Streptomyces ortus]
MLRRISLVVVGVLAVGFMAAAPAAAHPSDIEGCWASGGHVKVDDIKVADFDATCWSVD